MKVSPIQPKAFPLPREIIHLDMGIVQLSLVFLVVQLSVSSSGVMHAFRGRIRSFSSSSVFIHKKSSVVVY